MALSYVRGEADKSVLLDSIILLRSDVPPLSVGSAFRLLTQLGITLVTVHIWVVEDARLVSVWTVVPAFYVLLGGTLQRKVWKPKFESLNRNCPLAILTSQIDVCFCFVID